MKKAIQITPLRAILLLPVLGLLALFLAPVLYGFADAANLVALPALLLLVLGLVFWPQLRQWLAFLWRKRGGRVLLTVLGVLLGAILLLLFVLMGTVIAGMTQPESDAETVIVLGCQVRGERPSLLLDHRIEAAADLKAHPQAKCIVSGGQGSNESITEAECMRRGLVARGIAPERIFPEDASTSTQENLAFSKQIIVREGLSDRVLIVSNNFHIHRALTLAKAQGLEAEGLPAACEWYVLPLYVFREALALVYHAVFH